MNHPGVRHFAKKLAWFIESAAFVALGWISYSLGMKADDNLFGPLIGKTNECAPLLVLGSGAVIIAARMIRYFFADPTEAEKIIANCVNDALNNFRRKCFPDLPENTATDLNRVTIFKHYRWVWSVSPRRLWYRRWGKGRFPGSGWLVLLHRSGHTTQTSSTMFLAPDDSPQYAEGVAGQAWRGTTIRVRSLPNLENIKYRSVFFVIWYRMCVFAKKQNGITRSYEEDCKLVNAYAEATYTSGRIVWQRIKSGKRSPTSILAIPLESIDSRGWGVIVMDSSNKFECIDTEDRRFRLALSELNTNLSLYNVTRS
ncbi:hypothetical protein Mal52_11640 [Symmachiella dynata]|uniref:Uncharacterized protein n=1 Tax=Symmachiella dynata TaxID=2527995 RepID=A0A517ZJU1_9PLAN|nr:hypothetical protein Mal52_11640 [Symmachiella dynata]